VTVDSTFAMAWRKLAVVLPQAGPSDGTEARNATKRAYKYRERLPAVERGLTEAYYYDRIADDPDRQEAAYRAVLAVNPDEPTSLNNLGLMLNAQGKPAEAEPLLRHVVETTPMQSGMLNLEFSFALQGKDAAGDSLLAEFRRRWPESTRPDDMLRSRRYVRRDYRGADSMLRAPDFRPPTTQGDQVRLQWERLGTATALGRLGEAEQVASDLSATMSALGVAGTARYLKTMPAQFQTFFLGDSKALARHADSVLPPVVLNAIPEDQRPYQGLGYVYSMTGRPDRVRELKAEWTRVRPAEERNAADSVFWAALIAQAENRWRDAAMAFDAHRVMIKCPNCDLWDAARNWELAGQPDSALARYETSVTIPDYGADNGNTPIELGPTYKRLGNLYEAKGNRAKALEYYGNFVDLWRDADAVLQPQVTEVKGRMAELAGEK